MNTISRETGPSPVHQDHAGADAGMVAMAELLDLDAVVLGPYLLQLTNWLGELSDREPLRIVDLGSGTGTGALALAQHFTQAAVTALDLSPQLLHRLTKKASTLGLADRVRGMQTDLNEGWPQ
ncbi:class I SAM-dependent methyltransferase, partial [Kitasatospora sp. NPDC050463]|uniref:class I SAM-dependent methyltransferase n=1 Tax=Kitasatospora sp. NPDC050463 TaxID=3155786 RepID=UPI0033D8C2B1